MKNKLTITLMIGLFVSIALLRIVFKEQSSDPVPASKEIIAPVGVPSPVPSDIPNPSPVVLNTSIDSNQLNESEGATFIYHGADSMYAAN